MVETRINKNTKKYLITTSDSLHLKFWILNLVLEESLSSFDLTPFILQLRNLKLRDTESYRI